MVDIADKFIEKLENSKSKKPVDLLVIIDNGIDSYSIISDNGINKVIVSINGCSNLMHQMKNYLNSLKTVHNSRYHYCDSYGFIQTELTAEEAISVYQKFQNKVTLLPGDLTVILKP